MIRLRSNESIQSAVAWFESAKLEGIRQVRKAAIGTPKGFDKIIIQDPTAPPIWARFYSIANNQPIFCSRWEAQEKLETSMNGVTATVGLDTTLQIY